jgi:hypothetical protein
MPPDMPTSFEHPSQGPDERPKRESRPPDTEEDLVTNSALDSIIAEINELNALREAEEPEEEDEAAADTGHWVKPQEFRDSPEQPNPIQDERTTEEIEEKGPKAIRHLTEAKLAEIRKQINEIDEPPTTQRSGQIKAAQPEEISRGFGTLHEKTKVTTSRKGEISAGLGGIKVQGDRNRSPFAESVIEEPQPQAKYKRVTEEGVAKQAEALRKRLSKKAKILPVIESGHKRREVIRAKKEADRRSVEED